jgi:hypothetical protein
MLENFGDALQLYAVVIHGYCPPATPGGIAPGVPDVPTVAALAVDLALHGGYTRRFMMPMAARMIAMITTQNAAA